MGCGRSSSGRRGAGAPIEHAQDVVERIALRRRLARRPDQIDDVVEAQPLRGVRAGLVVDLLAHDRSLEIVHAERERRLREERRHHDPVRLDVIEVVEEESADGEIAKIVEAGRRRSLPAELDAELVVVRVIRERNVGEETARLVLQVAQQRQMLDAILDRLDVTVEHRAVGADPEPVRGPMDIDPVFGRQLLVRDGHAHAAAEYFGPATRERVESGLAQRNQNVLDRHLVDARDVRDLDGGECLDVDVRVARLEAAEHVA